MEIDGYQLKNSDTKCPYLEGRIFTSSNLIVNSLDEDGLERLLESGYRHFGLYFFRPECSYCSECRPIRVVVDKFRFSRSDKRVLRKNRNFTVKFTNNPLPAPVYYNLYRKHKRRFGEYESESYENWCSSFFSDLPFSRLLEIWDAGTLVAVTHLDVTGKIISAIYCYWDESYSSFSPGKFSILRGLQIALNEGIKFYYLGYYIKDNVHMAYKINYQPNQILEGGEWVGSSKPSVEIK